MPNTTFPSTPEALAALHRVDEEDEAAWEREFDDPGKVEKFTSWAEQSLAREEPRPIDPARL